jgi:hypothetical protein
MTASTKAVKAPAKTVKTKSAKAEAVVFTAPQVAAFIGVEAKLFRKWLRDGEGGGYDDGKYTRYKFADNAATAKMIQRAKAALVSA